VWSLKVTEAFPLSQFLVQVNIILVHEKLIELLPHLTVRSFDLTVELGGPWFDILMSHALVFYVPVKLCVELMATVSANRVNAGGELLARISADDS